MATADLFATRTMLGILEQMKPAKSFLLDTFFPRVEQSTTKYIDIEIWKGKRRMAPFVHPSMSAKPVERIARNIRTYEAPYVKEKMPYSGEDLLKTNPGETIYQGGMTPAQRAAEMLGVDLRELRDMLTRRCEWMAAQALNGGSIHVVGDGVDDTIDFLMLSTHKVTRSGNSAGTAAWDQSNGRPVTDLRTWRRLVAQDSGLVPDIVVVGSDVATAFLANAEVQKYLFTNYQNIVGSLSIDSLQDTGAELIGTLFGGGLKVIQYSEWYLDDNGVEQPMVPANAIFMGSTKARTARHFGAIRDIEANGTDQGGGSSNYAIPYFPKVWVEKDPSVRWVMLQAAPLVVPHQIDAFFKAVVV